MKKSPIQVQFEEIIKRKQLVEIDFSQESSIVAYILRASKDFITIAEISASATLLGVCVYKSLDAEVIHTDSIYLRKFTRQLTDDRLYKEATDSLKKLDTTDYKTFLTSLKKSQTLVELTNEDGDWLQGEIIDFDDKIILLDEYYTEYDERFARSYVNRAVIDCIAINTPRLRILEKAQASL